MSNDGYMGQNATPDASSCIIVGKRRLFVYYCFDASALCLLLRSRVFVGKARQKVMCMERTLFMSNLSVIDQLYSIAYFHVAYVCN